ncbi:hypothetical protein [Mesorhizobium sp. CAU 1741]|uniref:hypothetical protein n=1 Tax=Mesorhizobium sp. CAU 1741 TaxID=3140366 RepID=UPI00325AC97C
MSDDDNKSRPLVEWVFGAVSAAVVAAVLVFLAHEAIFGASRPAEFTVIVDRLEELETGTLVMVTVANTGDEAAADIGVQAEISIDGQEPSTREIRFDFIAAHAVRKGAFVVEGASISQDDLRFTVLGFVEP